MGISFSPDGPVFPEKLVDALLDGKVVFLCGAGISAPQLPDFSNLVKQCFEHIKVSMSPSETSSFKAGRFEEALGSLSRRIVDPGEMTRSVVHLLQPPKALDLEHHRTILRLSRDLENRPAIVTTNFDTLLEQALLEKMPGQDVRALSSAGQDLPAPGSTAFGGIVHLHGRMADLQIGLEETDLVVTSADYGDAYMRSGWASRFLFDLCRCKTIVLVGYSAGDAPVRYFLNVLEADRQRFPDLHPVYALDGVKTHAEPDDRWEALAVEPIGYEYGIDQQNRHVALWRDLKKLADVVERPRATRRAWAQELLAKPFSSASGANLHRVIWMFKGKSDLWSVVIEKVEDDAWLEFFEDHQLWSADQGAWVVARWLSRDFESVERLNRAIAWMERLGKAFASALTREIQQKKDLPLIWLRTWRLLVTCPPQPHAEWDVHSYMLQEVLKSPVVLNIDLQNAVDVLTPALRIEASNRELFGKPPSVTVERLNDLIWPRLSIRDLGSASMILDALCEVPQPFEVMNIATERLRKNAALSVDIGAIDEDYDSNDFAVPSVEPHEQNNHHDGPVFLVELLARLLPLVAATDRQAARGLTDAWRSMPGILGVRLWLHALRLPQIFTADEAISGVIGLPDHIFWTVRRELILVLRDRAAEAEVDVTWRVEERILTGGKTYFSRYSIEQGQADWRNHASDAAVWLRLNMLNTAGKLSMAGTTELAAIIKRREYLDRNVEDSDFFGSYSTGVRMISGDSQPIVDAPDDERLEVARSIIGSHDLEKRQGWSVYCRNDPRGALDTLLREPLEAINAPLWGDLIGSLSFIDPTQSAIRNELVGRVFDELKSAEDDFLTLIIERLSSLYWSASGMQDLAISNWWGRLFDTVVAQDVELLASKKDFYGKAINSPGGRLTQAILLEMQSHFKSDKLIEQQSFDAIAKAAGAAGRQGAYARAVLVHGISFVVAVKATHTVELLSKSLSQTSVEAEALRSILVAEARLSVEATRAFGAAILRGIKEFHGKGSYATAAASKVIAPALSIVRGEKDAAAWGIAVEDTAQILRISSPAIREGAADLLKQWITQIGDDPAAAWKTGIRPLLAAVWPRERALREVGQTHHFASLAIKAEDAFPEALDWLLPHLSPLTRTAATNDLENSQIPEKFPQATLTLLWRLFGSNDRGDLYGVPAILNRMAAVLPAIESDRRFQRLYQNGIHTD